jgi:hypothetical protein
MTSQAALWSVEESKDTQEVENECKSKPTYNDNNGNVIHSHRDQSLANPGRVGPGSPLLAYLVKLVNAQGAYLSIPQMILHGIL